MHHGNEVWVGSRVKLKVPDYSTAHVLAHKK